jgi:hypothetical protein
MDFLAPRRSRFLSALVLLALASSSRAAESKPREASQPPSPIEELPSDISRPENFSRFVEGSRAKQGDIDAPRASARGGEGRGPSAPLSLSRSQAGPRLEGKFVPASPSATAAPLAAARKPSAWTPELPVMKLAAVAGLGFMLIAGSMLGTPFDSRPAPEQLGEGLPPVSVRPAVRAPEASWGPEREESPSREPFIDTRMPVATWRAVSLPEQRLIEGWDASREKALGLASLADWLGAKGRVDGVDIPLLQAKLRRDA